VSTLGAVLTNAAIRRTPCPARWDFASN
jgi:hypothetical protein